MNYIGIDLGGTNIKGALVSAEGEILKEHSIPTRVDLGPEAVAGRIGQVIAQLSIGEDTVGGVGVGCPGTVDDASGIVRFAANLNFVNFDLRSALRAHTALPIPPRQRRKRRGAGRGAVRLRPRRGEHHRRHARHGRRRRRGARRQAPDRLHGSRRARSATWSSRKTAKSAPAAAVGCFEAYSSATALIRDTKRTMAAHPESLLHAIAAEQGGVDGRTAFLAKERGDEAGAQVVEDYIEHLACGLTNLVNISSPKCWLSRAA